jgi:SAM-dependent methyltransferase
VGASRRFFDLWARVYDLSPVQWAVYRPVHDAVLDALRLHGGGRLLDLGCGTGLLATRLGRALPGSWVAGCDFSRGMLAQAARRDPEGRWVQGDALALPFGAASFDAVVSTESFHWFPDQRAALAEILRVLRPGGRFLAALVHPPLALVSQLAAWGSWLAGEPFVWPSRREMRALIEGAGFHVETQHRIFRLPAGLLLPPVLTVALRPRASGAGTGSSRAETGAGSRGRGERRRLQGRGDRLRRRAGPRRAGR